MAKGKKKAAAAKKNSFDITFLILVLAIVTFGLIMLFSASYAYAFYRNDGDSFYYIKRQLTFAIVGIVAMLFISKINYRIFKKFANVIYIISLILLVIVLFMRPLNNAKRWIIVGGFTFQPSEIAKFAIILVFGRMIENYGPKMSTFRYGVLPFVILLAAVCGLMVLEPHLSGTILIVTISFVMMFVGGTKIRWFALAGGLAAGALSFIVFATDKIEYAAERLQFWLDPFMSPLDEGFQTIQSLYAIGSGGLMGLGLGNSRQKYLYIPEPHNDFIFAIVCEELGLIGAIAVITLFALLVWRGLVIAIRAKDRFGSMVAMGLTLQVGVQAILNIAVVTNTIPNTGISLPFFSYGGTSLMMLLAQMGIILSVSRQASLEKT